MSSDEKMRETAYKWFSGGSKRGEYMMIAYQLLLDGEPISVVDILSTKKNMSTKKYLEITPTPSEDDDYNEIKNALKELRKLLEWKGCKLVTTKGDCDKRLSIYTLENNTGNDDPLLEELTYTSKLKLEDYVNFCKTADGFMPDGWFTHFFQRHPILRDKVLRSKEGKQQIEGGANPILRNIDMLPEFFEWIQKKQVVKLIMKPFVQPRCEVVIHPQYLKEYNGRWYVYGYGIRDGKDVFPPFSLPLDRIVSKPELVNIEYIEAEPGFYDTYFKDIIGVTHGFYDGKERIEMGKQDIVIRIHTEYMYGLVTTKKFHHSQRETLPFGKQPDGREFGEITLSLEPNNELVGRILQMGTALEVVSPGELRERLKHDIETLYARYE